MALDVTISGRAGKELKTVPPGDGARIRQKIRDYANDPSASNHDVVPLVGSTGDFRLRVGDWRVIFSVTGNVMMVRHVLHRREAYR